MGGNGKSENEKPANGIRIKIRFTLLPKCVSQMRSACNCWTKESLLTLTIISYVSAADAAVAVTAADTVGTESLFP